MHHVLDDYTVDRVIKVYTDLRLYCHAALKSRTSSSLFSRIFRYLAATLLHVNPGILYLNPGQSGVHPNFETRKIGTNCSEREVRMAANRIFTPQFRLSIVERVLKDESVGAQLHSFQRTHNVDWRLREPGGESVAAKESCRRSSSESSRTLWDRAYEAGYLTAVWHFQKHY
jgi:hypothetical protein